MSPHATIISARVDMPTTASHTAANDAAAFLEKRGITVTRWFGSDAVGSRIKYVDSDLIAYFGHGKRGEVGSHLLTPAISKQNSKLVKGSIVVLVACYAGEKFANELVKSGARAVIGHIGPMYTGAGKSYDTFIEGFQTEIHELAEGRTAGEACSQAKAFWFSASKRVFNEAEARALSNAANRVVVGDTDATIW